MKITTSSSVAINVSEVRQSEISSWSSILNLSMIYATCTNGSSVSRGESCWLYIEIPTFLKQLTMVISSSVDHDSSSIIIASSIVMFANSLLELIALIYFRITLVWHLAFNDRITRWPIVCVTEVVFGNEKMRSIALGVQGNYQLWILPYGSELGISNSSILSNLWRSLCLSSFLVSFVLTWQGLDVLEVPRIFAFSHDK